MSADTIVEQRTRPGSSFTRTSTSRRNSVRCGVPYSRFRAAAVRRDGRRWREGGPRVPRDGQACRRGHRYVGTSFTARGLRAGTDYYFRVVATSRSVRRDAIQRGALLARPDIERRSVDRDPRHRAVPSTRHRRGRASHGSGRRPTAIRSFSRPTADGRGDNQNWTG